MYQGRFAPSPTGLLHLGSLAAALASWADAQAHGGGWRVRMEDVDSARCKRAWGEGILAQLAAVGLLRGSLDEVVWQSDRGAAYAQALKTLRSQGLTYRCSCTRQRLAALGGVYDGHCRLQSPTVVTPEKSRAGNAALSHGSALTSERLNLAKCPRPNLLWHDRRLGVQTCDFERDVLQAVGDFTLRRKDGDWSYQLAVVVDDAAQGITHVVRGEDLVDNTPRQRLLQCLLGLPELSYLHIALLRGSDGQKLSKQNHAPEWQARSPQEALALLIQAAEHLGFEGVAHLSIGAATTDADVGAWLAQFVQRWQAKYRL